MKILQCNPGASNFCIKDEILAAVSEVIDSGWYILGQKVKDFEKEFADFCNTSYALGVGNGTDALELALRSLSLPAGAKVATVSLTASATGAAIQRAGNVPYWVDIDAETLTMKPEALYDTIEKCPDIKAIIPVHLYGSPAAMPEIIEIAEAKSIPVIEDCAQAHGAKINQKEVGSWGVCGCFSFYPTKNLGAIGDGGALVTSNSKLYEDALSLRQYGWKKRFYSEEKGINSRLDELQAAVLSVKLKKLEKDNIARRRIASMYDDGFKDLAMELPCQSSGNFNVYHQYVIRTNKRDQLQEFLRSNNVMSAVHYPYGLHEQKAFQECSSLDLSNTNKVIKNILSLPMYPEMSDNDVYYVIETVTKFFK